AHRVCRRTRTADRADGDTAIAIHVVSVLGQPGCRACGAGGSAGPGSRTDPRVPGATRSAGGGAEFDRRVRLPFSARGLLRVSVVRRVAGKARAGWQAIALRR